MPAIIKKSCGLVGELIATCPPTALHLVSILISRGGGENDKKEWHAEDSSKWRKPRISLTLNADTGLCTE